MVVHALQASSRPDGLLHLPAHVDHLHGTACIPGSLRPGSGGSIDSSSMSDHSKHTAHKVRLGTVLQGVRDVDWMPPTRLFRQHKIASGSRGAAVHSHMAYCQTHAAL